MVRYIAATPVTHRGPRLSQPITLVNPCALDAKAAPAPDVWSDCRASVSGGRQRAYTFRLNSSWTALAMHEPDSLPHSLMCAECNY